MRFTYQGTSYLIEFERQRKVPTGSVAMVPRTYTTARILKVTGPGKKDVEVFREYTVGHNPRDTFSYEAGRKYALTLAMYDAPTKGGGEPLMGTRLTKEFRTAVWLAYHARVYPNLNLNSGEVLGLKS